MHADKILIKTTIAELNDAHNDSYNSKSLFEETEVNER